MTVYSILKEKRSGCGGADAPHDPCVCRRCTRTIESGCPSARTPAGRNGGDPLAKDTLDAVRHAEQEAEKILENAAHRSAAIRQSAENKAAELRAQRLQQAEEKRGRLLADAQADADDYTRRAQEETAALAQQLRQKAEENGPKTIRAILDRITG